MNIYWVLPNEPHQTGGPLLALKLAHLLNENTIFESSLVLADDQNNPRYAHIDTAIAKAARNPGRSLFAVTFGPLVPQQIKYIRSRCASPILYYAQSIGWKQHRRSFFSSRLYLPGSPDIVCVSRYVMSQWNTHAPHSRVALVPPIISDEFHYRDKERVIDLFVHHRKQSAYCRERLLPVLRNERIHLEEIDTWIGQKELAETLNQTKIFLYHTDLLLQKGWRYPLGEGFGLPPAEALMCGACIATDMSGGVNDFLDQNNSIKLLSRSPEEDSRKILHAINTFTSMKEQAIELRSRYSVEKTLASWEKLLTDWYL